MYLSKSFPSHRLLAIIKSLAFLPVILFPSKIQAENPDFNKNLEHMHQSLVEIGDRSDGTKGEKAAMELIVKHLEAFNIPYRRDPLSSFGPGYSYSENILGIIPGLNEDNIFLAAPVDSSAFGIALMLYLASHIKAGEHENGLIMAFLGAENGSDSYYPYGSRRAQINIEQSGSQAVIYLQSEYHPEKWRLQTGGNNSLPPYWLIKSLTSLLNQHKLSYGLNGVDLLVAKAGMQGNTSATRVWVQGGTPIARLEGLASPSSSDSSLSEHETAERFLNVISSLLDSPPAKNNTAEYKYLFLRFLDLPPVIIPEIIYIPVLLLLAGILLVIILLNHRIIRLNFRRFRPYWKLLPALMAIIFFFLFLTSLIMESFVLATGLPDIWKQQTNFFVFIKIILSSLLSINFVMFISGIHLPNHAHFYSYSALSTSIILIFVFTGINTNLGIYVLWSCVFLLAMTTVRQQRYKIFCLTLSALPHLGGLFLTVNRNYTEVVNFIVFNRIEGNLFLSMILFPLVMGVLSIAYRKTKKWNFTFPLVNFLLSASLLLGLFWFLNLDKSVSSTAKNTDNSQTVNLVSAGSLNLEQSSRSFLGRRSVTFRAESPSPPISLKIYLRSIKPFTLHSSSFPFQISSSGSEAEIFVGRHPPFPLEIVFTVNNEADLTMDIQASWNDSSESSRSAQERRHYSLKIGA